MDLGERLRTVPDFPKPGIRFIDITPLIRDADAFAESLDLMQSFANDLECDVVVSPEARGFIVGAPLAARLRRGFVPVRKPGHLPWRSERSAYQLEYGEAALDIHVDALAPGDRALVVDDLLATGGTVGAACELVRRLGGEVVGCAFLVELAFLNGRERLGDIPVFSAVRMERS